MFPGGKQLTSVGVALRAPNFAQKRLGKLRQLLWEKEGADVFTHLRFPRVRSGRRNGEKHTEMNELWYWILSDVIFLWFKNTLDAKNEVFGRCESGTVFSLDLHFVCFVA